MLRAIRELCRTDAVTLCTLYESHKQLLELQILSHSGVDVVPIKHRVSKISAVMRSLTTAEPYHLARFRSREQHRSIERLLARCEYDLIWCHLVWTLPNIPKTQLPIIVDSQNVDSVFWESHREGSRSRIVRAYAALNARLWRRCEQVLLQRADVVLAVAADDERVFREIVPQAVVWLAPNGVDSPKPTMVVQQPSERPTVVFCASMHLRMNEEAAFWLLRHVIPRVKWGKDLRWQLVGGHPSRRLREEASRLGVEVTGWVSDVEPFLRGATIAVVPVHMGAGTKIKTLESMAAGIPVISTAVGLQGIPAESGVHAISVDDPADFADALDRLLSDGDLRSRIGRAGQELVLRRFQWGEIYRTARQAVRDVVSRKAIETNTSRVSTSSVSAVSRPPRD
jgi:glycosyltransferase involved in cell wall biosynthesis